MRHALLVMGHGNLNIMKKYMEILDDERFDFYIHIDKKSKDDGRWLADVCKKLKVFFTERIPVYWGHHSQTQTEMILLKTAFNASVPYDYYHLISSVDMPLMTPNEIDDFFEKNKGKEFVRIFGNGEQHGEANWRMHYRYPFITKYKRSKYEPISKIKKALISRVLRFKRYPGTDIVRDKGWQVYSGDAWWSFTNGFVKVLVDFEDEMLKYWTDCYVSDECFAATVIKHTPEYLSNWSNFYTREVDWVRGFPYTWGNESCDFDMLMNSTAIFARKFDPNKMEIVNELYDKLIERKNHEERE